MRSNQEIAARIIADLFTEQRAVLMDPSDQKAILTSRRAGKSWTLAAILVCACLLEQDAYAIYCSTTLQHAKRVLWFILRQFNRRYHIGIRFNDNLNVARMPGGGIIECIGAERPEDYSERFVGTPFVAVVVDECGSFRPAILRYLYRTIFEPSLIDFGGDFILGGTPRGWTQTGDEPGDNLFFESTSGLLPTWSAHRWNTTQNVSIKAKWLRKLASLKRENPDVEKTIWYRREYLGEWVIDTSNLVYSEYSPDRHLIASFSPWDNAQWTLGIDHGYYDATAFSLSAWRARELVVVESHKRSKMRTDQIAAVIGDYRASHPRLRIYADPAGKTVNRDLRREYRLPIQDADRGTKHDDIRSYNADLARNRIKIVASSCEGYVKEIAQLPWRRQGDGTLVEDRKYDNHCCDSSLYSWRGAYHWKDAPTQEEAPRRRESDQVRRARQASLRALQGKPRR